MEGVESIFNSTKEGDILLLDSPTGTGKSAMVLCGVLEAMSDDEKLVVITRTHSQYKIFIQEFMRVKRKHDDLKFGLLVGRSNICPMHVGYETCGFLRKNSLSQIKDGTYWYGEGEIAKYRKIASDKPKSAICPYFINCFQRNQTTPLFDGEAMKLINNQLNKPQTPEKFNKLCMDREYPKCPYELMKSTLSSCDVMLLHYHYLIDPGVRDAVISSRWLGCGFENIHLVVDEAHNLAPYIQDICSLEFSKEDVLNAIKLVEKGELHGVEYPLNPLKGNIGDIVVLLDDLNLFLEHWFSNKSKSELLGGLIEDVIPEKQMFKASDGSLEYLNLAANLVKTQFNKRKKGREIPDEIPVPGIVNISKTLKQISRQTEDRFIKTIRIKPLSKSVGKTLSGKINIADYEISLKIIDIDPRDAVKYLSDNFKSLTLISGTLAPTELYQKLLFYDEIKVKEMSIPSPFPSENRLMLCCKDVTSLKRYRDNEENVFNVKKCMDGLFDAEGNIAMFFTSYGLKERYLDYARDLCHKTGKRFMDENRGIDKHKFIEEYKKHGNAAMLAVCRGNFSEGVDFIGGAMNAVAVIGLPLAPWNMKQKKVNRYYERIFGPDVGEEIAYYLPAVTAAVQALGRCIRSPHEKGILVLGDSRYYSEAATGAKRLLPRWMQDEMQVVYSKEIESLIKQKIDGWGSLSEQNEIIPSIKTDYKDDFKRADTLINQNTEIAHTIISCLEHLQINVGRILLADILSGSNSKKISGLNLAGSLHYGSSKKYSREQIVNMIDQLIEKDYFSVKRVDSVYYRPTLFVTDKGKEAIRNGEEIQLELPVENKEEEITLSEPEEILYGELKSFRKRAALEKNLPFYCIFDNKTLQRIAKARPRNYEELLKLKGIGKAKLKAYGDEIIEIMGRGDMAKTYSVNEIRETYSSAYKKWTNEEEEKLIDEFNSGLSSSEIAALHGRKRGAIKSRLRRLDLIE